VTERRDTRLPAAWFERSAQEVAKELLGCYLVHETAEGRVAGRIVETEAYLGTIDRASHSFSGVPTERTRAMFGEKGRAYVYRIYGLHWCLNVVCGQVGTPQAVLIRALEPIEGIAQMRARQPDCPANRLENALCRGPGKLCRAMDITAARYDADLRGNELFLTPGKLAASERIAATARIGVDYAGDDALKIWRFFIAGNPCVSGTKKLNASGEEATIRRSKKA
jgi:DNA-3-methyladenine glycosylase